MSVPHTKCQRRIEKILRKYNIPTSLPQNTVSIPSYRPDIVTRIRNHNFVVIDVVRANFDYDFRGMVMLLSIKNVVEKGILILCRDFVSRDEKNILEVIEKIRKYGELPHWSVSRNENGELRRELVILKEEEFEEWLINEMKETTFWSPNNLVI